jgi:hypothetical protein
MLKLFGIDVQLQSEPDFIQIPKEAIFIASVNGGQAEKPSKLFPHFFRRLIEPSSISSRARGEGARGMFRAAHDRASSRSSFWPIRSRSNDPSTRNHNPVIMRLVPEDQGVGCHGTTRD